MMNSIVIHEQELPVIKSNFDEMKEELKAKLEKYSNIIVTEETLADCKSMQKELSRIRREIDGARMDVKREMVKPINDFSDQMSELMTMVVDVEQPIKAGLNVFDQKRIKEKEKDIDAIILEQGMGSKLSEKYLEQIEYNPKWMNKTYSTAQIKEDVARQVSDLKALEALHDDQRQAIDQAVATANIMHKLQTPLEAEPYINLVIEREWSLAKVLSNIGETAQAQNLAETAAVEAHEAQKTEIVPENTPNTGAVLRTVTMTVTTSDEKFRALTAFLKENGIAWEKVDV